MNSINLTNPFEPGPQVAVQTFACNRAYSRSASRLFFVPANFPNKNPVACANPASWRASFAPESDMVTAPLAVDGVAVAAAKGSSLEGSC